jgi:hypothetical protein
MQVNEKVKVVTACPPATLTSTAGDGQYINLRDANHAEVVINIKNGTSVTAANVQLLQASNIAGVDEKVLSFTDYFKNEDTATSDAFTEATASDNHFLTLTTNAKSIQYKVDIPFRNLDSANGFSFVRVDFASMANATGSAVYMLDTAYAPDTVTVITDN